MIKYGPFDIPGLDYFKFGNCFIGSDAAMRFKLTPSESEISAEVWFGEKCYELSEIETTELFPMEEESLYKINDFLALRQKSHH